ncbi:MAG: hypothetical protein ACNA7M_09850 [Roseovarius sp.]
MGRVLLVSGRGYLAKLVKPVAAALVFCAVAPAQAQTQTLESYLHSMSEAEVTFRGMITYNRGGFGETPFMFYAPDGALFPATINTATETRERVETECAQSAFMVRLEELCRIEGIGKIELHGSGLRLSVGRVILLQKP